MSFKDQLREVLEDYSDKYSTGLQLSNIVKLDKATDQAIASIVELVSELVGDDEPEDATSNITIFVSGEPVEVFSPTKSRNALRGRQRTRLTQEDTE